MTPLAWFFVRAVLLVVIVEFVLWAERRAGRS